METESPQVREWTIQTPTGMMTFAGRLLGRATTESDRHRGHELQEYAPRGHRCSACRWYTCEIYDVDGRYLIYTRGDTQVPGEDPIPRVTFASDAGGMLDVLVQRQPLARPDPHDRDTWTWSPPRLSRSARVCLEQAAIYDPAILQILADWNSRTSASPAHAAPDTVYLPVDRGQRVGSDTALRSPGKGDRPATNFIGYEDVNGLIIGPCPRPKDRS
jgi:hypothetical protein